MFSSWGRASSHTSPPKLRQPTQGFVWAQLYLESILTNHYLSCLFTNHQPTAKLIIMWLLHSPTAHHIVQLSLHKLHCFSNHIILTNPTSMGFHQLPLTNHRLKWRSPNITLHITQPRCIWSSMSARVPVSWWPPRCCKCGSAGPQPPSGTRRTGAPPRPPAPQSLGLCRECVGNAQSMPLAYQTWMHPWIHPQAMEIG